MITLKEKSLNSFKAGRLLLEEELYCNSVQSFYYSSFQLSIDIILVKDNISINELDTMTRNKNSHNITINKVAELVSKNSNWKKGKFINIMNKNKRIRVHAIYKDKETNQTIAEGVMKDCSIINKVIFSIYETIHNHKTHKLVSNFEFEFLLQYYSIHRQHHLLLQPNICYQHKSD